MINHEGAKFTKKFFQDFVNFVPSWLMNPFCAAKFSFIFLQR
jgi:hypothetical protein